MSRPTARTVALDALLRMEESGGYSNLVLDRALEAAGLDRRDGALASAIFYGVLEKRVTLDWLLAHCLRDPARKLDPVVQAALRCGAYQIWFLDRVPDSAAVNETVNAVKARGRQGLAGFVNGALRNLIRQKETLSLPQEESPADWSVRYAVPERLVRLWRDAYGPDFTRRLLEAFQAPAETYLRVNRRKTAAADLQASLAKRGIALEPLDFPEGAARLGHAGSPADLPEFREGLFHVQDLSAQLACRLLDPRPGERVIDCCAAPGGKTFTLAQEVGETGAVTALDLHPSRVKLITEGAARLGLGNVTARTADLTKPPDLPPADKVLCDAPCSGLGVIRRKPEIREKDPADLQELPELQSAILSNAAKLVKPGGRLVYATCTLNPAENAGVADRFLREHADFAPVKIDLPGIVRAVEEPPCQLTMTPFTGASDGFFTAAFERKI